MSDKLTPQQLKHYRTFYGWEAVGVGRKLLDHIAAVEAERDEAAALLRRFLDRLAELDTCLYCGETWDDDAPDKHAPDCLILAARERLAKMEKETT
jgi:rubrerythrin